MMGIFVYTGCKKNDFANTNQMSANERQNETADKILRYLESQKSKSSTPTISILNKNANIDLLKENLDISAARKEALNDMLDLWLVPIKEGLIEKKNLDKNSTLTLFLIVDKLGKINSGSIVYFQPSDGQKHTSLPPNTFRNMLSGKSVALDGVYKMLLVSGKLISQFKTKNGRLLSTSTVQKKDGENISTLSTNQACIDWYLVTTYYWSDGTVTKEVEYLGRTCTGCAQDGYATAVICDEEGGGGGGGNNTEEIETADDEASTSDSDSPPSSNLSGEVSLNGSNPETRWVAHVSYAFNRTTQTFVYINGGSPYPVPPNQSFIDDNGEYAMLYNSLYGSPQFTSTLLTTNSFYAHFSFIGSYKYYFITGPLTVLKNRYIAKIVTHN